MRPTSIEPGVRQVVDALLRETGWAGEHWDERTRHFARTLVEAFRTSLGTLQISTCVAAAYTAARAEAPLASPQYHETWAKVALVLTARELMREARRELDKREQVFDALTRLVGELARATAAIAGRDGVVPDEPRPRPSQRAVQAARSALAQAREGAGSDHAAGEFVRACMHQLKHTVSLLTVGDDPGDGVIRGAVLRADRAVRQAGARSWIDAPAATRRGIARLALVEAASGLALAVPAQGASDPESIAQNLWLARTAAQLAACCNRVDDWLVGRDEDETGADAAGGDALDVSELESDADTEPLEVAVKETQTIVKTLQIDATDAAWRTAGSQFVKLAREPLVGVLSRHLGPDDPSFRARVAAFLETEIGTALLASMLSAGLAAMPAVAGDVPQRLSRELRVRAMADAGDVVAEVLMGPLRQVMSLYLRDMPSVEVAPAEPAALGAPPVIATARVATTSNVVAMPTGERGGTLGA
jgi:hypothetical protein